jgi:hypothetical protein
VILELDNLSLVNFLRSTAGERSMIAGVWHEIKDLSRWFSCFYISFVNREGNEAAHFCAKLASQASPVCEWLEAFPSGLVGISNKDGDWVSFYANAKKISICILVSKKSTNTLVQAPYVPVVKMLWSWQAGFSIGV